MVLEFTQPLFDCGPSQEVEVEVEEEEEGLMVEIMKAYRKRIRRGAE